MPSFRPLPQELVDQIIDKLGEDSRVPHDKKGPNDRVGVAREALHACTLVSKNWTGRSRAHLFNEVEIRSDSIGSLLIPLGTVFPYVKKLGIQLRSENYRLFPSTELLTLFYTAPIVCLEFTEGTLAPGWAHIVEFITALSTTLQTVTFKSCSFPPNLIHNVVLAHPGLKKLHLYSCQIERAKLNDPTALPHSTNLELVFFATVNRGTKVPLMTMIAKLPVKFCRLNFDYAPTRSMTHSANTLIEANADSLSSLTVHITVRTSRLLSQNKITANCQPILQCFGTTGRCSASEAVPTYQS
ncbi:hypothetical protein BJ322DRAFT_1088199 [Thelephora terrestris]|uniref:Uncharacterized protein n=1 Tax=Thelephora terrestris TaxID=56493 RepID=A0A9P6H7Z6_9AGAM|nr:hypothetical protein BJ322DRAFT_1088199 [Thelephora terrestris]